MHPRSAGRDLRARGKSLLNDGDFGVGVKAFLLWFNSLSWRARNLDEVDVSSSRLSLHHDTLDRILPTPWK